MWTKIKKINRLISLLFVLTLVQSVFGQQILKSDKEEVFELCDGFSRSKYDFLTDTDSKNFKSYVSDTLFIYYGALKKYFQLLEYKLQYTPVVVKKVSMIENQYQCTMVVNDSIEYSLDVKGHKNNFVVVGFDGQRFKTDNIKTLTHLIDSVTFIQKQKDTVENTVSAFFKGINYLNSTGSSSKLKSSCTPKSLKYHEYRYSIDSIRNNRHPKKFVISELDRTEITSDSTANCHVNSNSGSSTMNLVRHKGKWVVVGENDGHRFNESFERLQKEKMQLELYDEINEGLDTFFNHVLHYMRFGDMHTLESQTSAQVAHIIYLINLQLGDYDRERVALHGFQISKQWDRIETTNDFTEVTFTKRGHDIKLVKRDIWVVVGIDPLTFQNRASWISKNTPGYTRFIGMYFDQFDTDEDIEVEMTIQEPRIDTSVLSANYRYKTPPESSVGHERLFELLENSISNRSAKQLPEEHGKVYLEFVIELDGSVSNIVVLSSENEKLNVIAIDILKTLPSWQPGSSLFSGPSRSKYILPIWF